MNRTALVFLFAAAVGILPAQTQPDFFVPFEGLAKDLRTDADLAKAATPAARKAEIRSLLANHTQELALYALGASVYTSLVEPDRIDKQVGASGAGAGSTTLVSRGSVPSILGVAVESGALYQSVSGSVVTFRLNPSGLARALAANSYLPARPPINAALLEKAIHRLSASASFDFDRGSSPGTFTGERSQLKEATIRYDIINKRDPRHLSHITAIAHVENSLGPIVETITKYFEALREAPGYAAWSEATAETLASINMQDDQTLRAALFRAGDEFAPIASVPGVQKFAGNLVEQIKAYRTIRNSVFQNIAKSSILTFEYAFNRLTLPEEALAALPTGTTVPDLSTARLIFSSPAGSWGEATLNGSATFFNSTLPQMRGNLRDVQVAGGLDIRLPELRGVGKPVLTFAGLGAFLHQQPFGVTVRLRDVETADGAIGVFQAKLTFPAGASGVRIPVSFTVANRSEFNTEKEVRGTIGITFDLDTLFAR